MEHSEVEKDISERLFGKDGIMNLKHLTPPLPFILLCYKAEEGFVGDDLGMFAKACHEFFPTPTYQGICLTRNTNIKEVLKTTEEFDPLFDSHLQKTNQYVKGGTIETKNTLVFFTGVGRDKDKVGSYLIDENDFRKIDEEMIGNVQFKIHQSNEFANLYQDTNTMFRSNHTLILNAGYEYSIDIEPQVVQTTDSFKKMSFSQRKCKLQSETEDNSIFKFYTMKNCQYECNIKMAEQICHCIPWDFIHNLQEAQECDLFGRTCFYNAMEKITKSNDQNHCQKCIKECDYATYQAEVTRQIKIPVDNIAGPYNMGYGKCTGQKAFCDFLLKSNGTNLIDQGLANAYDTLRKVVTSHSQYNISRVKMLRDMVIVHLRILKPDVQLIDAKYTVLDKFANFGGNFGIFAEITGCTFLGILNFFIILFKLIFSSRQNEN